MPRQHPRPVGPPGFRPHSGPRTGATYSPLVTEALHVRPERLIAFGDQIAIELLLPAPDRSGRIGARAVSLEEGRIVFGRRWVLVLNRQEPMNLSANRNRLPY